MRLRRAGLRPFSLPFVRPLATAHGEIRARQGWLVALEDDVGRAGLGEATPLAEFGTETPERCERALTAGLAELLDGAARSLADARALVARGRRSAPCATAGLEAALCDRAALERGQSLAAWFRSEAGLAGAPESSVAVQALIGGDAPGEVADSAARARRGGFETFKLKLAVSPRQRDLALDLERVSALRSSVGPVARIRLDANEAWSRAEAEAALERLAPFEIDYLEQPVERADLAALAALSEVGRRLGVGVAADEALLGAGLEACLARRAATILVVKPAALGGLGPAAALAHRAAREGLRVVWSTLLDGAVSRTMAVHLAAGLGPADETHGLATGAWLARDLVASPTPLAGRLACPSNAAGLGLGAISLFDGAAEGAGEGAGKDEPWLGPMRVFEARS